MNFLETILKSALDFLVFVLEAPETAAATLAIGCAFGVRYFPAACISCLTAAGLLYTGHPGLGLLVAGALAAAWLIDCAFYTERDCFRCGGNGRFKRQFLFMNTSKTCRRCDGAARKIRLGTRLLTRVFGDHFV